MSYNKLKLVAVMLAACGLSACQNGVIATPLGDFGVKSRDAEKTVIGFMPKAQQKPNIALPSGFQGRWAWTASSKARAEVCRGSYDSDDIVILEVDAAKNTLGYHYYEEFEEAYWQKMTVQNANSISGTMRMGFHGMGEEKTDWTTAQTTWTLSRDGKQLTETKTGRGGSIVYLLCGRSLK